MLLSELTKRLCNGDESPLSAPDATAKLRWMRGRTLPYANSPDTTGPIKNTTFWMLCVYMAEHTATPKSIGALEAFIQSKTGKNGSFSPQRVEGALAELGVLKEWEAGGMEKKFDGPTLFGMAFDAVRLAWIGDIKYESGRIRSGAAKGKLKNKRDGQGIDFANRWEAEQLADDWKSADAEETPPEQPSAANLDFPDGAMYGRAKEITLGMEMPAGLAYPAVLAALSVLPEADEIDDTRISLYTLLLATAGGGKDTAIRRSIASLQLPESSWLDGAPMSDRGLMVMLGGTPAKKKQPEIPGPRRLLLVTKQAEDVLLKMKVMNASLASLFSGLWDDNNKTVADRQGKQHCNCRLSWLGGVTIDRDNPEEFGMLFGRELSRGLLSRLLFGYSGGRFGYKRWIPPCQGEPTDESLYNQIGMVQGQGRMPITTPEAEALRQKWVEASKDDETGRLAFLLERVAKLTAWASGTDVTAECMAAATALMEWQKRLRDVFRIGMADERDRRAVFAELFQRAAGTKYGPGVRFSWRQLAHDRKWNSKYDPNMMRQVIEGLIGNGVVNGDTDERTYRLLSPYVSLAGEKP
jgi:hypothetical protein